MKTINLLLLSIIVIITSSCSVSKALPDPKVAHVDPYGGIAQISKKGEYTPIMGELLTIQDSVLYILNDKGVNQIMISDLKKIRLFYAKGKNYGYLYSIAPLIPITHGIGGIITFPVNMVTLTIITYKAKNAYSITNRQVSYDDLKMFARFPQGFPKDLNLSDIKPRDVK